MNDAMLLWPNRRGRTTSESLSVCATTKVTPSGLRQGRFSHRRALRADLGTHSHEITSEYCSGVSSMVKSLLMKFF